MSCSFTMKYSVVLLAIVVRVNCSIAERSPSLLSSCKGGGALDSRLFAADAHLQLLQRGAKQLHSSAVLEASRHKVLHAAKLEDVRRPRTGRAHASEGEGVKGLARDTLLFWALGIFITILGQTVMVPGLLMQKLVHMNIASETAAQKSHDVPEPASASDPFTDKQSEPEAEPVLVRQYYYDKIWIAGICVFGLGQLLCWIAFGMAPQSICAPLQCWNIPVCMVLARMLLNEKLPKNCGFYCAILIFGCIWVIVFGPKPPTAYNGETLHVVADHICRPVLLLPLTFMAAMYAFATLVAPALNSKVPIAAAYVMCSAGCAWYSASLSKCVAMLLMTSTLTGNVEITVATAEFGLILVSFAVMATAQIVFFNLALKYGDAIAIVPLYEGLSMTGQIVFGGVLWQEFAGEKWRDFVGFSAGVACVVVGLTLITQASLDSGGFLDSPTHASKEPATNETADDPMRPPSTSWLSVLMPWSSDACWTS